MPIQQMLLGAGGVTEADPGQVVLNPGTTSWTVPAGVTSVSVVCIGAGGLGSNYGGGGAALAYGNNISVTPGASIAVSIADYNQPGNPNLYADGDDTWFQSTTHLKAGGGKGTGTMAGGVPSGTLKTAGYEGGSGGSPFCSWGNCSPGGGGGCAGYTGDGGDGDNGGSSTGGDGNGDAAGGGAGSTDPSTNCRTGGSGGGVDVIGHCTSSTPGTGGGGDDGMEGNHGCGNANNGGGGVGGEYGGGAGGIIGTSCGNSSQGGSGRIRIIWPGDTRSYPSTNVCNV